VFNKEVRLDLFFLDRRPTLSVVDVGTNFIVARFLTAESAEVVWNTFLYCWVLLYTGFPSSMLTDQGSIFTSKDWEENCKNAAISLRHTGTESHNSLGSGETYHAMLRRVYNKVSMTYPNQHADLRLALTVKAINDSAGPHGLVPSLLVFGVLPRMPHAPSEFPNHDERMKTMQTARNEYEAIIASSRVNKALSKKVPTAVH